MDGMEEIQQQVKDMSLVSGNKNDDVVKKEVEEDSKTETGGDEKEAENEEQEENVGGEGGDQQQTTVESNGRKIFIGGTAYMTSEQHLREYFETFGEVEEVVIPCDRYTGRPRGFGFVTFKDSDVTEKVLDDSIEHKIRDKVVEVKRAVPRGSSHHPSFRRNNKYHQQQQGGAASMMGGRHHQGQGQQYGGVRTNDGKTNINDYLNNTNKIFVGGLHTSVLGDEFEAHFEKFGKVADAVIMYDRATGRSRGFGFVTFEEDAGMKAAIEHRPHVLRGKQVEVKMAEPRGKSMSNKKNGGRGGFRRGSGGVRGGRGNFPTNGVPMIPPTSMNGSTNGFPPQFAPIPPYGVQGGMYGGYPSFPPTDGSSPYSAQSHYAPSSPGSSMNGYGFTAPVVPGMMPGMIPPSGTWPSATGGLVSDDGSKTVKSTTSGENQNL